MVCKSATGTKELKRQIKALRKTKRKPRTKITYIEIIVRMLS